MILARYFAVFVILLSSAFSCKSDSDCSLNGMCQGGVCKCYTGWTADDCGVLDLQPIPYRPNGYNLTGSGTSSWGAKIIQDPNDTSLHHLFVAEFINGCGLNSWSPYSRIVRAVSRSGVLGPYEFAAEVVGTFAHNPTVVWSPNDELYLLYYIGCSQSPPPGCAASPPPFQCGPGNNEIGESGVSVQTSPDLINWTPQGMVLNSTSGDSWNTDLTNPSPLPLYFGKSSSLNQFLVAYRGMPNNGASGIEQIGIASATDGSYSGPYDISGGPVIANVSNEDPFIWQDPRGYFHMLVHCTDYGLCEGSNEALVGHHAFAECWNCAWTYSNTTVAYNTTVQFADDGSSTTYYRRERPQLFFDIAGDPAYLVNGVQEFGYTSSHTLITPIGSSPQK